MNIFQAIRESNSLGMREDFPAKLFDILKRRDEQLGIEGMVLFENAGDLACHILEMKTDPISCELYHKEYIDELVRYCIAISLISKYFYPIIEQVDTLIDRKIKIGEFDEL